MHAVYDMFKSTVYEFNPESEKDFDELREVLQNGPALYCVEVASNGVKFQDSYSTITPNMSIEIELVAGEELSKKQIMKILALSRGLSTPADLRWVEETLRDLPLDHGAVFALQDDSIGFMGTTFFVIANKLTRTAA